MSLHTLIDTCCLELGLPTVAVSGYSAATVATTQQTHIARLRQFLYRASKIARDQALWAELRREGSITLADGQANYALPEDFDKWYNESQWNRTSDWRVVGPTSGQEWQVRKSSVGTSSIYEHYAIRELGMKQIYLDPTPSSADTVYFEYQSNQWFHPMTWAASTAFAAGTYCFYDGNTYYSSAGGTTGSTAPTHTSGSVSDGGVTWAYYSTPLTSFTYGTDEMAIDEDFLALGVQWLYNRARGFPYKEMKADWFQDLRRIPGKIKGAKSLSLASSPRNIFISTSNIPESGYGS